VSPILLLLSIPCKLFKPASLAASVRILPTRFVAGYLREHVTVPGRAELAAVRTGRDTVASPAIAACTSHARGIAGRQYPPPDSLATAELAALA
jgi:hypothetical protein